VSHRCKTDWYRLNALKLSSATLACARAAPFEIGCSEWVQEPTYTTAIAIASSIVGMIGGDRIDCIA
jgi:hypothetical protein